MTCVVVARGALAGLAALLVTVAAARADAGNGGTAPAGLAAPDPAITVGGGWSEFSWAGTGTPADQEGAFTFTSQRRVAVSVTDDFCRGDAFRVDDGANLLGMTTAVATGACDNTGPNAAFRDPTYSNGTFLADPGSHSITITTVNNPFNYGEAWLRVDPPPACSIKSIDNGPPKRIRIAVRSPFLGLVSIQQTQATNAVVSIPAITTGERDEVVVTASKTNGGQAAKVALLVTDTADNTTACDPILATISARRRFARVPAAEWRLTLRNDRPGVRAVRVVVNGLRLAVVRLRPGATRTISLRRAMRPGHRNTVLLTPIGTAGRRVDVLIGS